MSAVPILKHCTVIGALEKILTEGQLKTRKSLGIAGNKKKAIGIENSIVDPDFVFFTPQLNIRPDPMENVCLFLDGSILKDTPYYFVNDANLFGPGYGEKRGKTCRCAHTYHHNLEKLGIPPPTGVCAKSSLEEIVGKLNYDATLCDGGPEVGIYGNVSIEDSLLKISLTEEDFEKLPESIRERFKTKFILLKDSKPKTSLSLINSVLLRAAQATTGGGSAKKTRKRKTQRTRKAQRKT